MTIGSHQQTVGKSQTYLTPPEIINSLGSFDTDPCAAYPRPWDCAVLNYTEADNGLEMPWHGRVWLNPPFDRYQVGKWVNRLAQHGNGIALLHARTEAEWFQPCWRADSLLFLRKRLRFYREDGSPHPANSGAPLVLVAFGGQNTEHLRRSGLAGVLVRSCETMTPQA